MTTERENAVLLDVRPDKRLIWQHGKSVRNLVVTINAKSGVQEDSASRPRNLAFVVDVSSASWDANRSLAVPALRAVLEALGPDDRVSLVTFGSEARVALKSVPVTDEGRKSLEAALIILGPEQGCNAVDAWLAGALCVAENMKDRPDALNQVLLFSNWKAVPVGGYIDKVRRHLDFLEGRGLSTAAIALERDSPLAILSTLGGQLDEWSSHSGDPLRLKNYLMTRYLGTGVPLAEDLVLTVTASEGSGIMFLDELATGQRSQSISREFPSLKAANPITMVVQSMFPEGKPGEQALVSCALSWRSTAFEGQRSNSSVDVAFEFAPGSKNTPEKPDHGVAVAVAGAWKAAILSGVHDLNAEREIDRAEEFIREQTIHFERYCRASDIEPRALKDLMQALTDIHRPWRRRE
jgi:Ca-activated chloride channel family protein